MKFSHQFSLPGIFLLLPGLVFLIAFVVDCCPGSAVGFYLIGVALSLPCIGFSRGWIKWTALALALFFLVAANAEHQTGLRYAKFRQEKAASAKLKNP